MTSHIEKLKSEKTPLLTAQSREPAYVSAVKANFLSQEILQNRSDIRSVYNIKEPRRLLGADGPLQPVIDASSIGRNGAAFAGGVEAISYDPSLDLSQPLMGLTLGAFLVSAPLQTAEAAKRCLYAGKIGDTEGQGLALASMGITVPLTGAGATALAEKTLRVYDMVQTLHNVNYQPVAEVSHSISVLGTVTLVLFAIYNAVLVFISAFQWYKKSQMREEVEAIPSKVESLKEKDEKGNDQILVSDDVRGWLDKKFDFTQELKKHTNEEFTQLALEEGEKWLSKLEKDWKSLGLEPINIGKKERKELVKQLLLQHEKMGLFMGIPGKKGQDLMIALGQKLMTERLRAREEQKLSRVLGQAIIDKYKNTTEDVSKKEVLAEIDKGITKSKWLILLGIIGVICAVCATIFTAGWGALFVALIFVLSAVLWAYGWDRHRLMNQWNGQETGKFDKVMLIFSSLLNTVAVAGTIAGMVIFSGGIALVPLLLLIGVGLFWCVVNARGWYILARHTNRPWEYEKVVTLKSFHQLVQQETDAQKIDGFFQKMSPSDKALFQGRKDWKNVSGQIISQLVANRVSQLTDLNSYSRSLLQTL